MKRHIGQRVFSILLSAALLAGMLPTAAGAASGGPVDPEEHITVLVELEGAPAAEVAAYGTRGDADYKAELMEVQADVLSLAQEALELEVGYQYNTLFNGFSCDISAGDMDALARMEGVKGVYPVQYYDAPETVEGEPVATPQMTQSGPVTGNTEMTQAGYSGQGMVVAILDSGLNLDHPAFAVYDDMLGDVALTEADVTAKINAAAENNSTGGWGMYVSKKIPFACNYTNLTNSTTLSHKNGHGTHVAGIAAGYERNEEKAVFSGSAPGAQILGMQIFGDTGGTSSDIYIKALEDAFNLGADVINMSLGVPRGFSNTGAADNPEEAIYDRMAEAGVLVCISAGNSASYFQNWDASYPDYATVGSPSTFGRNISVSSVDNVGQDASKDGVIRFSRAFSSVGPATTLDMRPVLTSVGGAVSSANAEYTPGSDKNKYVPQWGTSMSCPNLAGTFASLLSYLRGTEGLDKETAGKTALKLMESAAVPVLGGNDNYATVLQQGAGLGNSATAQAAYELGIYLDNPIQELRDDPTKTGVYTMTLTLKNATASAVTYTPGAVVMTDEVVDGINTQNSTYLYKTGEPITPAKAEVTFSPETVTVPAGGTVDVTATVTLTDAGKTYMNDTFPHGGYIDGFITFTPPEGSGAPEVHATYLAFYGDWGTVPAFAPFTPMEEPITLAKNAAPNVAPASEVKLGYCDVNNNHTWGDDYIPLGDNPMNGWNATADSEGDTAPYKAQHAALPGGSKTDTVLYNSLVVEPIALRNVQSLTFSVTNAEGSEAYRVNETGRNSKSGFNSETKSWAKGNFTWDAYSEISGEGLIPGTRWLADGTVAKVTVSAEMPYTRPGSAANEVQTALQVDVTIDQTAPTLAVSGAVYDPAANTLTVSATDSQYVAAIYLVDSAGNTVDCDLFSEDAPNTPVTATLDVSGHAAGDAVKVRAMDYASNWDEKEITLSTTPVTPGPVTVTFNVNGGTQPTSHADYTQTVAVGSAPTRPAANPTRTDYTFKGWARSVNGPVLSTFPVTVADTHVIYYAQWEAVTPTVSVALAYNETTKTITATPTVNLSRYDITYAWTENNAAAPGAASGNTYTLPQDALPGEHTYTCVATVTHKGDATKTATSAPVSKTVTVPQPDVPQPVPEQVTVTFHVNGGVQPASGGDYVQTVDVGKAPARPAQDPTRRDYTFLGWAASANGPVLTTFPVTVADKNVTYYARWEATTPVVSIALAYNEANRTITAIPTVNLSRYNITYAWMEDGEAASGARGNVYTISQDTQPGVHVYTCVATVTHPDDATKTVSSSPVSQTVTISQPVGPTPGPDDPTPGPDDPTPGPDDPTPGPDDPTPGPDKPDPGPDRPNPGSNGGGGVAPASASTSDRRKNGDGATVVAVTGPTGDKTITVTDAAGKQLAKVVIPSEIALPGEDERFDDVPAGHWADDAIHRMASLGLFKGVAGKGKRFDMSSSMTRGMLTEVLYRLSNGEPDGSAFSFFDVAQDAWYSQSVIWATNRGVVNGTGAGTFQPQRAITRQELAVMLYRYAQFLGAAEEPQTGLLYGFLDGGSTSDWAASGVAWCVQTGILQGKGSAILAPTAQVTRAEAATMLSRLLQALK